VCYSSNYDVPAVIRSSCNLKWSLRCKTRFKKLDTPHLRKKIIFGTVFLALSVFLAIGSFIMINTPYGLILVFSLSFACVLIGGLLGLIGALS